MHAVFQYTGHQGNKPASVGTMLTYLIIHVVYIVLM